MQALSVLILTEKFCFHAQNKGLPVYMNSLTIHRLVLIATLIFSKFYNDIFYGNNYLSQMGGIDLAELNALEL